MGKGEMEERKQGKRKEEGTGRKGEREEVDKAQRGKRGRMEK